MEHYWCSLLTIPVCVLSVLIPPLPVCLFSWRLKRQRLLRSPGHQQSLSPPLPPRHLTDETQNDNIQICLVHDKEKFKTLKTLMLKMLQGILN